MRILWIVAGLLSFAPIVTGRAQSNPFVVVVHATNTRTSVTRTELSDLFLKRLRTWPGRITAIPVNQNRRSVVRSDFTRATHHKSVAEIEIYWQQQIFSGRDTPPIVKNSDAEVLAFIRANPGAVGYVRAGTQLGSDVKVLVVDER